MICSLLTNHIVLSSVQLRDILGRCLRLYPVMMSPHQHLITGTCMFASLSHILLDIDNINTGVTKNKYNGLQGINVTATLN